jgi:hypothetical protein
MEDILEIEGGAPIRIPEGEYDARVLSAKRVRKFNRPAIHFRFQIVSMDQFNGMLLDGWTPLDEKGKPAKRSKLVRWYLSLEDWGRRDRVSLKAFLQRLLKIKVRTVMKDYEQKPLLPKFYYSVVEDVLCTVAHLGLGVGKAERS